MPRTATWTPTITSSEDYQVYARWTTHTTQATNATYTVHHTGGSTPVVVNHQTDGGQWHLLGTFPLAAGQNHRVDLSAQANGSVVADAVYVVPASAATNAVTWTPTLTTTETLDIYAKWTSEADRADDVTYTVHHAGGSTPIVVNQRQNGGTWHHLGQFSMAPSSNHRVVVADTTNQTTKARSVPRP
ncbi:MAG: hypothetical protein NPIRA05_06950 [Nitrospirales bacterium]|nr:MAG: hypothetical protein NPIRA05_06950 [Nitrospirales bacterium]